MAKVSKYLNFDGNTSQAFGFYQSVYRTDYVGHVTRMGDVQVEGMPPVTDDVENLIMNIQLPTIGDHTLRGSDIVEAWGHGLNKGNNISIMVHTNTRDEADALFAKLSEAGSVEMPMADQFRGDYYGAFKDKFSVP